MVAIDKQTSGVTMDEVFEGYPEDGTPEQQVLWLKAKVREIHDRTEARMAAIEVRQAEVEARVARYEEALEEQARRIADIEARLDATGIGDFGSDAAEVEIPPTRH